MAIDKDLLEILVCPESKAPLVLDGDTLVSTDPETRRRYRIEDVRYRTKVRSVVLSNLVHDLRAAGIELAVPVVDVRK